MFSRRFSCLRPVLSLLALAALSLPARPEGSTAPEPAPDSNMPNAANATVAFTGAAPDELSAPGVAEVTIDWRKTGRRVEPFIYSLNVFNIVRSRPAVLPAWREGMSYMAPRLWRLHNAELSNAWFDAKTGGWDYVKIRALLGELRPPDGTLLMLNINGWPDAYDTDKDHRLDPDRVGDYARLCADLVRFVNLELKAGFLYWEVTNERDVPYWRQLPSGRQPDVPALAAIYNQAAVAMRAVDPAIKIGGPAACYPLPARPLQEFVRLTRDNLDFFSFHSYASGVTSESDQTIYEKVAIIAKNTADLARWLKEVAPDRAIELHLNEYNVSYTWRSNEVRMINHKSAVFDALSLIAFAQVPGLAAANAWNDMDRVYGKMDGAGALRPAAHVYHYFNTYLQGTIASSLSSADKAVVPFAIADGNGGRPAFALVNRTNGEQTVTVRFAGAPVSAAWTTASTDAAGLHADAPVSLSSPLTLPPHSVHIYWSN